MLLTRLMFAVSGAIFVGSGSRLLGLWYDLVVLKMSQRDAFADVIVQHWLTGVGAAIGGFVSFVALSFALSRLRAPGLTI